MKKPNKLAKLFGKPVTIGGMSISVGAVALSTILAIGVIGGTVYTVSTRMHAKSNASANVQGQAGVSELTKSEDEQTGDASSSTNQAVAQADTQNEEGNLTSLPATEQANDSETGTNLNEDKTGTVPSGHKHHLTTKTLSESTCLVNGIAVETCDGCSYSRQYSLPLKEHTPSIWMTAANNTITGRAIRNRYCTTCGLLVATESVPVTPVIIQTSSGSNSSSGSNNSNDSQNSDNTNHSEQKHEHQYVLMSTVNPSCTVAGKKNFRCNCGATYVETIGATGHNVTSWSVTKAAECVSKGERQGECTNCHETVREDIPETGHTKGTWVTDTPASCLVAGTRHTDCTSCGMRMNEVIPATGHTESTWKTETSATCTANGLEYTECTTCHTKLNTRNVTALGHNWVEGATVSSTCTEQGNTSYECSRCHDTKQVVIGQANHTVSDWITVTTPTCTENGSKHKECTVCHAEIESEVIPATGHTVSEWMIDTPATCTGLGSRHKECTTCSATLTTESIPALGHSYPATPTSHTDANCLTDGADVYLCSRVGCNVTNSVRIPATGHRIGEWEITKAATDLAEGTRVKKCQNCGSVMETGTIAKLPHTHTFDTLVESQAATCTTDGYEIKKCRCGQTDRTTLTKTNHANFTWTTDQDPTYIAPTYTTTGERQKVCDDCGYIIERETIAVKPHTHNYTEATTPATCTASGKTIKTCSMCGDTKTTVIPATGHTESAWITDTTATCTQAGSRYKECTVCHTELVREPVAMIAHTESAWITDTTATCTQAGSKHKECTVCQAELARETIPMIAHNMSGWTTTTAPICEQTGTETNSCANCTYKQTRGIPALGHDYSGDWIIDTPASEGSAGTRHKECKRNGCTGRITEDIQQIPAHVHSYAETARTPATCSAVGSITYTCSDIACGDSYSTEIAKLPHTPSEWTVKTPATEQAEGLEERTCTVCHVQIDTRVIPKLVHVHNYETTSQAATCTVDGWTKETCSCGDIITTVIPMTGHSYGTAVVVNPTCTVAGTSTLTCGTCSHKEITNIPATGHHFVETSRVSATCSASGSVSYKCDNAGCTETKTDVLEQLTHDYASKMVAPTCTEAGYTIKTCKNCGDTQRVDEVVALGHDEGTWIIKTEAALGITGEEELKCTRCNEVLETREIPMIMTDGTNTVYTIDIANNQTTNVIGYFDDSQAEEMAQLINQYRKDNGLSTLETSNKFFNGYAETRAVETSYIWDHVRADGCGVSYGENIATSNMSTTTVQEIFDSWINSKGHRDNILHDIYTKTAIKVFYQRHVLSTGKEVYIPYWVECFY